MTNEAGSSTILPSDEMTDAADSSTAARPNE